MNYNFKQYFDAISKKEFEDEKKQLRVNEALKVLDYINKTKKKPYAIYLQSDTDENLSQVLVLRPNGNYEIEYESNQFNPNLYPVPKSKISRRFQTIDEVIGKISDSRETGKGFFATPMSLEEYKKFI